MDKQEIIESDLRYVFELAKIHRELNSMSENEPKKKKEEKEVYIDNIIF